ncbi:MAG: calcium/sodium antiporter [Firmicutes bacterium]|nr:calcium/sodium antiporter [Bacillota bacterium]
MEFFIAVVLFIVGIALTVKGADYFINASKWLAMVTKISTVVIGATLIAFASNIPELFVSVFAEMRGAQDLAVANIVGSNIFNIAIAFGIIALIRPKKRDVPMARTNTVLLIITTLLLFALAMSNAISIVSAVFLLLLFVYFIYMNIRHTPAQEEERVKTNKKEIFVNIWLFIIGSVTMVGGSFLIVEYAQVIARSLGLSDMIIGLTIVAIGTSVTELIVSIVALAKHETGMSIGNIVGSNVFNAALIMPIIIFMAGGFQIAASLIWFDLPILLAMCLIMMVPTIITKKSYRWQGCLLVGLYVAYTCMLFVLY